MSTSGSASKQLTRNAPRVGDYLRGTRLRTTGAGTWFPAAGPGEELAGLLLIHPGVDLKVLVPTIARLVELDLPGVHQPHPKLVEQAGRNWLVTNSLPAPTLADVLDLGEHQDPASAAAILFDLADTLQRAHQAGLTHGALNARSVLISSEGTALITEWGTKAATSPKDDIKAWAELAQMLAEQCDVDIQPDEKGRPPKEGPAILAEPTAEAAVATLLAASELAIKSGLASARYKLTDLAEAAERPALAETARAWLQGVNEDGVPVIRAPKPKKSGPKPEKKAKAQAKKAQADEAQAKKAQADEAQAEKAQAKKAQTAKTQARATDTPTPPTPKPASVSPETAEPKATSAPSATEAKPTPDSATSAPSPAEAKPTPSPTTSAPGPSPDTAASSAPAPGSETDAANPAPASSEQVRETSSDSGSKAKTSSPEKTGSSPAAEGGDGAAKRAPSRSSATTDQSTATADPATTKLPIPSTSSRTKTGPTGTADPATTKLPVPPASSRTKTGPTTPAEPETTALPTPPADPPTTALRLPGGRPSPRPRNPRPVERTGPSPVTRSGPLPSVSPRPATPRRQPTETRPNTPPGGTPRPQRGQSAPARTPASSSGVSTPLPRTVTSSGGLPVQPLRTPTPPSGISAPPTGTAATPATSGTMPRWYSLVLGGLTALAILAAIATLFMLLGHDQSEPVLRVDSVTVWAQPEAEGCTLIGVITTNGAPGTVVYGWASEAGTGPVVTESLQENRRQVETRFRWTAEGSQSPDPVVTLQVLVPELKQATAHPASSCR